MNKRSKNRLNAQICSDTSVYVVIRVQNFETFRLIGHTGVFPWFFSSTTNWVESGYWNDNLRWFGREWQWWWRIDCWACCQAIRGFPGFSLWLGQIERDAHEQTHGCWDYRMLTVHDLAKASSVVKRKRAEWARWHGSYQWLEIRWFLTAHPLCAR